MGIYDALGGNQGAEQMLEHILSLLDEDLLTLWSGRYAADKQMRRISREVFQRLLAEAPSAVPRGLDPSWVAVKNGAPPFVLSNQRRTVQYAPPTFQMSNGWRHIRAADISSAGICKVNYLVECDGEHDEDCDEEQIVVGVVDPTFSFPPKSPKFLHAYGARHKDSVDPAPLYGHATETSRAKVFVTSLGSDEFGNQSCEAGVSSWDGNQFTLTMLIDTHSRRLSFLRGGEPILAKNGKPFQISGIPAQVVPVLEMAYHCHCKVTAS